MRVGISRNHLQLSDKLAREINSASRKPRDAKTEGLERMLMRRDTTIEAKKLQLATKLHQETIGAFSIRKEKRNKKALESLKKKVDVLRRVINKLRSINYYLESNFLQDLKLIKIKLNDKTPKIKEQNDLARDELEILEYTAYKLIEKAVVLDKKLLSEYGHKAKVFSSKENIELKDLGHVLRKESTILEHLEAKLPPPKLLSANLLKEPTFTHWVSRIFALLANFDYLYGNERKIFAKLRKNQNVRKRLNKKIEDLVMERFKLLEIMEEKASSIKNFRDKNLKAELHDFTTIINI